MENIEKEIKILDFLQGRLSKTGRQEVEHLLSSSPAFSARFNEVKRVWEGLDLRTVPEMDASVKTDFKAMLKTFELEKAHKKAGIWNTLTDLFKYKQQYNWGYAILLVGFGASIAWLLLQPSNSGVNNLSAMNDKKQTMMLSMLENPTAIERMKAVSYTQELAVVNDKVIEALLITLNTDPNENVRLVTLDALVKLAANPKVRAGLVSSIVKQDSELMQVALADAMLRLNEKSSLKSLKKILENDDSGNELIKRKLSQTVQKLESI